jgi:hypothetical protein
VRMVYVLVRPSGGSTGVARLFVAR